MMFKKLLTLALLLLLSKANAEVAHATLAASPSTSPVPSYCKFSCYAGEGTVESPYIVTVGSFLSSGTVSYYHVRDIEALIIESIADVNLALKNSGIDTVKITFQQLVNIPQSTYAFGEKSMANDLLDYTRNCDTCFYKSIDHGNDLSLIFHGYPNENNRGGVTEIGGYFAIINLLSSREDLRKVIVHEIGHMLGAGHQLGAINDDVVPSDVNAPEPKPYSNAVVCENSGALVASIVSTAEYSSKILQFSSPDMDCGTDDTDNKRTILELAQSQGGFRDIPLPHGGVRVLLSTTEVSEGDAVSVEVIRDDITSIGFVGLWVEGEALTTQDYHYIEFEEGQDRVSINIQTVQDNMWVEVNEILTLKLDYATALSVDESSNNYEITVLNIDDKSTTSNKKSGGSVAYILFLALLVLGFRVRA